MIKYKIIQYPIDEALVKMCITLLEKHGITELPCLRIGEKKALLKEKDTHIFLVWAGERRGYFILSQKEGDYITHYKSTKFAY